jgi:hypothetical protein
MALPTSVLLALRSTLLIVITSAVNTVTCHSAHHAHDCLCIVNTAQLYSATQSLYTACSPVIQCTEPRVTGTLPIVLTPIELTPIEQHTFLC